MFSPDCGVTEGYQRKLVKTTQVSGLRMRIAALHRQSSTISNICQLLNYNTLASQYPDYINITTLDNQLSDIQTLEICFLKFKEYVEQR